jgi:SAM-dependent methyltransferase
MSIWSRLTRRFRAAPARAGQGPAVRLGAEAADDGPIPLPPRLMRELVGATDPRCYSNPTGGAVFRQVSPGASVLDFGCGCGRTARQLLQQRERPRRYLGIDIHRGMIDWCNLHLAPLADNFAFVHADVFNPGHNPTASRRVAPFPAADGSFDLVYANSVFTHLNQDQAEFYLREAARVLRPEGVVLATWFLFDKADFPFMQEFQNALFINESDPTNAVVFDKLWLRRTAAAAGLRLTEIRPPVIRGFHWDVGMRRAEAGGAEAEFPPDDAPRGECRPPVHSLEPGRIAAA